MYPSRHFIVNLVLSFLLFPIYGYNVLILFISGFLIDADHYLWCMIKFKSLDFFYCYHYCKERKNEIKNALHIFHVVEFWILVLIIALIFRNDYTILFLIGLSVHLSMDFIHEYRFNLFSTRTKIFLLWLYQKLSS